MVTSLLYGAQFSVWHGLTHFGRFGDGSDQLAELGMVHSIRLGAV